MTDTNHRSTQKPALEHAAPEATNHRGPAEESSTDSAGEGPRIQTIHDLVRSGDYHIPAAAIADRMIERIIVDKQGGGS